MLSNIELEDWKTSYEKSWLGITCRTRFETLIESIQPTWLGRKGNICAWKATFLDTKHVLLSKLYNLYPFTPAEYSMKIHLLALKSNFILWETKLEAKHKHPKDLKWWYDSVLWKSKSKGVWLLCLAIGILLTRYVAINTAFPQNWTGKCEWDNRVLATLRRC